MTIDRAIRTALLMSEERRGVPFVVYERKNLDYDVSNGQVRNVREIVTVEAGRLL